MSDQDDWSVHGDFWQGDAHWRVARVTLDERMSAPMVATLRLVREADAEADMVALGRSATLELRQGELERTFSGIVTRVEPLGRRSGLVHARAVLESRVALARTTKRWRIFQDVTAEMIAQTVLGAMPGVSVESRLRRPYAPVAYRVQYGQDDLGFVCRVLEDAGISWLIEPSSAGETVLLLDAAGGFVPIAPEPELRVANGPLGTRAPGLTSVSFSLRVPSAGGSQRDWVWEQAAVHEVTTVVTGRDAAGMQAAALDPLIVGLGAHVSFPGASVGGTAELDPTEQLEDEYLRRLGRDQLCRCDADVLSAAAGRYFDLDLDEREGTRMLITGARHVASFPEADPVASAGGVAEAGYACSFECVPLDVDPRPEQLAERPFARGVETAVVVGPPGEEIHTDEYGRIKVRMHWDRSGSSDADASCWIRVSHATAGDGWGQQGIPRVGMEVLVSFLGGDPDRPLCTGVVYNGAHASPYALPDEKTKSGFRSQSTPAAPGKAGYNELTFDDAAGAEQVYLRAQRDLRAEVLRCETHTVGADQAVHVGHDQRVTVGGDRHEHVEGNHTLRIDGGGLEGTKGSAVEVTGDVAVGVSKTVTIEAGEQIELVVGATKVVLTQQTLQLLAGGGASMNLDHVASTAARDGGKLRLGSTAKLESAGGGFVLLCEAVSQIGSADARVDVTDGVTLWGKLEERLALAARKLEVSCGNISMVATDGSTMTLDHEVSITATTSVTCASGSGSMSLGQGGAKLEGTKVEVNAAALATMMAPIVKLN